MADLNENRPFDFRLLLAFVLMFAIVTIYTTYMQPDPPEEKAGAEDTPVEVERPPGTALLEPAINNTTDPAQISAAIPGEDSIILADTVVVETPLFRATFSTLGADLLTYELKTYHYITEESTEQPISMVPSSRVNTLRFEFWGQPLKLWQRGFTAGAQRVVLTESGDSNSLTFSWDYGDGLEIKKTYIFHGDRFSFDIILSIPPDLPVPLEREYTFGWEPGLAPTEARVEDDLENIAAAALLGRDIEEVKEIDDADRPRRFGGQVHWAGVRTKYFLNAVIPRNVTPEEFIADRRLGMIHQEGEQFRVPYFSARFAVPLTYGEKIEHHYTVFMGPLDYFVLKDHNVDLEGLLHLGWKYLIRPFAIFVLWSFQKIYDVIPNYGLVIILFGFLVKAIFHPLTKKSMSSMQRMKDMSPKLQKLRDKYKDDSQRLNRETMKMYKETGFNPLSGCLPLVAQMPVFFALYQVLRNSIQMRGADFVGHITDLSQKDSLYILPIIMTISFFWQQKMTTTDPKQKALVYIMPLVFGFLFAQSPAGLTLYWTVYNAFSVAEQYIIKAKKKNEPVVDS